MVDAIRSIPADVAPARRARTQAIREQVYHGYEMPMVALRGAPRLWSKYEYDRPWSVAAARLAASPELKKGENQLNRDHVHEAVDLVDELLSEVRTVAETADLLDERLVTCTVTHDEHRKIKSRKAGLVGWERYAEIPRAATYEEALVLASESEDETPGATGAPGV